MSEQSATGTPRSRASGHAAPQQGNVVTRFFAAIRLFLRQILDELRKVVRPTREELTTYTLVVITFVVVIMFIVFGLDTVITRFVFWVFAGS